MLFAALRTVRAVVELDRSQADAYALCRAAVERALLERGVADAQMDADPDRRLLRVSYVAGGHASEQPMALALALVGDGPVRVEISAPPGGGATVSRNREADVAKLARFLVEHSDARLVSGP